MTNIIIVSFYFAFTLFLNFNFNFNFCAQRRAQYFLKISNFCIERNILTKHQLSHLHYHFNYFNIFLQLIFSTKKYYKHTSLDLFIKQINEQVKNKEYIIIRKRSKLSKLKIFMKVVLRCDRGDKWLD